jgi:hypothetical protein
MVTMNTFILLTGTATPTTINRERIFAFPWQKWLHQRATIKRCTYIVYLVKEFINGYELSICA